MIAHCTVFSVARNAPGPHRLSSSPDEVRHRLSGPLRSGSYNNSLLGLVGVYYGEMAPTFSSLSVRYLLRDREIPSTLSDVEKGDRMSPIVPRRTPALVRVGRGGV